MCPLTWPGPRFSENEFTQNSTELARDHQHAADKTSAPKLRLHNPTKHLVRLKILLRDCSLDEIIDGKG